MNDALFFLRFGFNGADAPPCLASCDANGDGKASSIGDAIHLLNFVFLGGPRPPARFPDCGGPTDSDLEIGCATMPKCP